MPADPPDAARLLAVGSGEPRDLHFTDFPTLLRPDDVLVINETRVLRARLRGRRTPGGGAAEVLLLRPADGGAFRGDADTWHALVRPGRKLRAGAVVDLGPDAAVHIVAEHADGSRTVRFEATAPLAEILEAYGDVPLPPYVGAGDATRAARYQTMFARVPGSVAAPTASLHFTPRVVERIVASGVMLAPLVLDVGLGTFRPMDAESIDEHRMHAERYEIPASTARAVNAAKQAGRRIVVAGTTALRALEASALANGGAVAAGASEATLFITPGFEFRIVDALLTNFHLPRSTLLVLVSAFGGYARTRAAYATAIRRRYRFYSFGDAMFVERAVD